MAVLQDEAQSLGDSTAVELASASLAHIQERVLVQHDPPEPVEHKGGPLVSEQEERPDCH